MAATSSYMRGFIMTVKFRQVCSVAMPLAVLAFAVATVPQANAQDAAAEEFTLEEVVVTAQKREESL